MPAMFNRWATFIAALRRVREGISSRWSSGKEKVAVWYV